MGRAENFVEKGENACYQHLSFFHNVFKSPPCQGREKSGLCGTELSLRLTEHDGSYSFV